MMAGRDGFGGGGSCTEIYDFLIMLSFNQGEHRMSEMDWAKIRKNKLADAKSPDDWPADVAPISMEGLALLGIDKSDGQLFWDGKEIVVHTRLLKLRGFELFLLTVAAIGTLMQGIATFVPWLKLVTSWW